MQAGACRDEELDEVLGRSCAVYGLLAGTLCMGYIFSVVLAGAGLPSDGRRSWQGGDIAADVIHVLQGAVLLGWLTSIDRVSRLQWARRYPRRLGLALLCFAATPPVFSSLNEVPGLQFSIDAGVRFQWFLHLHPC